MRGSLETPLELNLATALMKSAFQKYFLRRGWNAISAGNGYSILTDGIHINDRAGNILADLIQQWLIRNEARTNGLPPERLGEAVHVALSTANPKARYAVVPHRFKNWTFLRLLPVRMFDNFIAKQMGLKKTEPASNGGLSHLKARSEVRSVGKECR